MYGRYNRTWLLLLSRLLHILLFAGKALKRVAERIGFEPTEPPKRPGGLATRCLKPLGHLPVLRVDPAELCHVFAVA